MGTDINYRVEVQNKNGKWEAVEIPNHYKKYTWDGAEVTPIVTLYDGRDYELFGILSPGVRDDTYPSIDDARGLPKDVSEATKAAYDEYDGGHSTTWFSLTELNAWLDVRDHFKPDYYDVLDDDERIAVDKDLDDVRDRFRYFVHAIEMTAGLTGYYVPACEIRVVLWFDC